MIPNSDRLLSLVKASNAMELLTLLGIIRRGEALELLLNDNLPFLRHTLKRIHEELGTYDATDPLYNEMDEEKKEKKLEIEDRPTLENLEERVRKRIEAQHGVRKFTVKEMQQKEAEKKNRDVSFYTNIVIGILLLLFFIKLAIFDTNIFGTVPAVQQNNNHHQNNPGSIRVEEIPFSDLPPEVLTGLKKQMKEDQEEDQRVSSSTESSVPTLSVHSSTPEKNEEKNQRN